MKIKRNRLQGLVFCLALTLSGVLCIIFAEVKWAPTSPIFIFTPAIDYTNFNNPSPLNFMISQTANNSTLKSRTEYLLHVSNFNLTLLERGLKMNGHTLTDLPPWSALWTDKIHLCVMFNLNGIEPATDVTDILVSYYFPFFRDITFIFDGARWKKPDSLPEFVDFIGCDSHQGWYQHKCIRSCMHRGTEETKGYLYIADDMFINLTMMADLPREKVWFSYMEPWAYSSILDPGPKHWGWWDPPYNNSKRLEEIINIMPNEWMKQLKETGGFPNHFKIVATTDIVYIPQRLKPKLTTAIDFIVNSTDLFCEIATCLAVNIAAPNQIIYFNYGYLWGANRNTTDIERRAKTAHFVHPVKLRIEQQRKLWIKLMDNQIQCIV